VKPPRDRFCASSQPPLRPACADLSFRHGTTRSDSPHTSAPALRYPHAATRLRCASLDAAGVASEVEHAFSICVGRNPAHRNSLGLRPSAPARRPRHTPSLRATGRHRPATGSRPTAGDLRRLEAPRHVLQRGPGACRPGHAARRQAQRRRRRRVPDAARLRRAAQGVARARDGRPREGPRRRADRPPVDHAPALRSHRWRGRRAREVPGLELRGQRPGPDRSDREEDARRGCYGNQVAVRVARRGRRRVGGGACVLDLRWWPTRCPSP
jgi:hypothetical protein